MQLLALLIAFITTTSALALPGIQSSVTNWVQNRRLKIAEEYMKKAVESRSKTLDAVDVKSILKYNSETRRHVGKSDSAVNKLLLVHDERQQNLLAKAVAAKNAGDFKTANQLFSRYGRKEQEMNSNIANLAALQKTWRKS